MATPCLGGVDEAALRAKPGRKRLGGAPDTRLMSRLGGLEKTQKPGKRR